MKFVIARQFGRGGKLEFCCAEKRFFFIGWLCMNRKIRPFSQNKNGFLQKTFLRCPQKFSISINQKLSICTNLSLLSPKAILFHLKHRKFAPSHNLLSAKNTAVLSMSALNPYAVTPEHRTDSKPFRCRFVRKIGFGTCRWKASLKVFPAEL